MQIPPQNLCSSFLPLHEPALPPLGCPAADRNVRVNICAEFVPLCASEKFC
jgi:hypothetical protein